MCLLAWKLRLRSGGYDNLQVVCPQEWDELLISDVQIYKPTLKSWFIVTNGQYAAQTNHVLLGKILASIQADVVAVDVKSELLGEKEKVRLTNHDIVAGLRRLYSDSAELTLVSKDWPHYLFIRTNVIDRVLVDGTLLSSFSALVERCRSKGLI